MMAAEFQSSKFIFLNQIPHRATQDEYEHLHEEEGARPRRSQAGEED